jgi:hypothetical protein
MNDTPDEILRKQLEIMMSIPEDVRIRQLFEMTELSRKIIRERILATDPDISETELNVEVFRTFYRSDFDDLSLQRIISGIRDFHSRDESPGKVRE